MAEIITCDLCVIGAGLGGLAAVAEARALGASVVLVERGRMGGDYLNAGTVPSRALAAAAAHAQALRNAGAFGIAADEPRINTRKVYDSLQQVVAALAPSREIAHVEASGAQVIHAEARFLDPRTIAAGDDIQVKARRFIIATGARSTVPPVPGLDAVPYFTTETIFDNTRKLTHLVVIGSGPLAVELAQTYARLGTQVTLAAPRAVLPGADPELADIATRRMLEESVDIRPDTEVVSIQPRSQGIGVIVRSAEQETMLDASHILVAGRRVPDVHALDLDKAGIRRSASEPDLLDLRNGIRTTNRRVYVIGDATGGDPRAHLAAWQARLAVRNALLAMPVGADAARMPSLVFTDPELAEIGLNEASARAKHGNDFRVVRASFADNDRARATRQAYGLVKVIFGKGGRLLGAGIVGDRAGELIALFSLALANGLTAKHLAELLAPHPTLAEIVAEVGREYLREGAVSAFTQRLLALVRLLP